MLLPAIRILTISATTFCLMGTSAFAQSSADLSNQAGGGASTKQEAGEGTLAAGTAVNAELNQSLDTKKIKTGDAVNARTTEAVKSDGRTVLPKGTKLAGHVTSATAKFKGDAESALALQFDRAIFKDGREVPLNVTIQALAAAPGIAAVGGDDLEGSGMAGGAAPSGGRGAIGGAASTVGGAASGAASTVPRTAQNATGAVNSTVNGAAGATAGAAGSMVGGLNASGQLAANSRGVFGINGVTLESSASGAAQVSVISSSGKSVHLESGTRMLLVTRAETSASAQR
jgi:hypothetical protein